MQKLDLSEQQPSTAPEENSNENKSEVDEIMQMIQNQDLATEKKVKKTEDSAMTKKARLTFIIFAVIAVIAGVLTGMGSYKLRQQKRVTDTTAVLPTDVSQIKNGDVFGVKDSATFADSASGYLEKGGVNGEGSHRLLREGGTSQTVALTSSVTDLDQFVGMEVKIWGETNKAQEAGWFMDVGRLEVVNISATAPIQSLD